MSGHGGPRNGSGRKAGLANKHTREIADKAHVEGITPLEVMLNTMRKAWEDGNAEGMDPMQALTHRMAAVETAKHAAPYMHPKLAQTELTGKDGGSLIVELVKCG